MGSPVIASVHGLASATIDPVDDDLYFDGDPATDSSRRHLERVLKGGPPRRRWPWIVAILGGAAFAAWRMTKPGERAKPADVPADRSHDTKPS
jgi:hypothetical protein